MDLTYWNFNNTHLDKTSIRPNLLKFQHHFMNLDLCNRVTIRIVFLHQMPLPNNDFWSNVMWSFSGLISFKWKEKMLISNSWTKLRIRTVMMNTRTGNLISVYFVIVFNSFINCFCTSWNIWRNLHVNSNNFELQNGNRKFHTEIGSAFKWVSLSELLNRLGLFITVQYP